MAKPKTFNPSMNLCFNPSFTGIALVAYTQCQQSPFYQLVSILLLLELPWWLKLEEAKSNQAGMFQSFFYWNCLGGIMCLFCCVLLNASFNPSFTGIALVAMRRIFLV